MEVFSHVRVLAQQGLLDDGLVEPLQLLVELHVPLVDVVDVIVWVVAAPPAIYRICDEDGSVGLLVACTC